MNLFDEFQWRGVIHAHSEGLGEVLAKEKVTAYIGFDPSAPSLHVGSLLPIMGLARLQQFGHTPLAIMGGGTGLIGDPSGKSKERPLLDKTEVEKNMEGQREQLSRFLDFEAKDNAARFINNYDWLGKFNLIEFLRDIGKYVSVNNMLAKESVRRRIESEEGISYTEFSYLLLQAYDFVELYDRYHCRLQMGGSDQWGNIVAGTDLIRRMRSGKAYGLVYPLLTTASGIKFGKTEAGTIWLDAEWTSPYRFYQFWLNSEDADVIQYLKFFTWLTQPEIEEVETSLNQHPEAREAQRTLAKEITRMVHGETAVGKAEKASQVLFGGEIEGLRADEVRDIFQDVPSSDLPKSELEGEGLRIVDLLAKAGVANSRGEARRLVQGGGVYLNNHRIANLQKTVSVSDTVDGRFLVLRKGQKKYHLVRIMD